MAGPTVPFARDRHTGRKLGRYEVLCQLSSGGMSEIFLAFQRGPGGFLKLVVLKKILPDIQAEEDIVKMFLNEARVTAGFNHPYIAQVFDLDVSRGELFLAMEFVPGATLIEIARACRDARRPIPSGFSLTVARDTALALHYAHTFKDAAGRRRTVIHRDVAEKNIMVTFEGTTKLLDFGIARAMDRVGRTAAGKVRGTSGYMSPEQILGQTIDPRSDIFSLGVVLHECLTGMRLFYGKGAEEGMRAALERKPEPPSTQNPAISQALDEVVLRALERRREERFATAIDFARALELAAGNALWSAEQCGELVQTYFSERRNQTRLLLEDLLPEDRTGELTPPVPPTAARPGGETPSQEVRTVKIPVLASLPASLRVAGSPPDEKTTRLDAPREPAPADSEPTVLRPPDHVPTHAETPVAFPPQAARPLAGRLFYAALTGALAAAILTAVALALKLF